MRHILLVEDDTVTCDIIGEYLRTSGYYFHLAGTLQQAREESIKQPMDLIVLDVSLPDGEGFDLALEFRGETTCPPIVYISSHIAIEDIRKGFETGAQDYLKKPIILEELGIRIKRILGDFCTYSSPDRYIGSYKFNPTSHTLQHGDNYVILGRLQAAVLDELSVRVGCVVSKNDLLEKYWDGATYFTSRNLDSVIVKLRERFKMDSSVHFLALKKEGYRLVIF